MKKTAILFSILLTSIFSTAQETKLTEEIKKHIEARIENNFNVGITVALIDGDAVEYYNFGKTALENGTAINENSVFEIGSISKVFTTILLADKVKKGEMKLDDPISKYLPETVKVPSRNGKLITINNLATHTSALPRMPSNFKPKDPGNPFTDYTYEQLYTFLSGYELTRDIGVKSEYSNLGMGLLGHILELQSGKTYEELVLEIIAKPIEMNYTALTFSDVMKKRLAIGHRGSIAVSNWDITSLAGAGGIRSTATDMVKFVKANMGVTKSDLYEAMKLSHQPAFKNETNGNEIGLGWHYENDNSVIWHNGQTGGYNSFAGFLKGTQKGVVVLTNTSENLTALGFKLLGSPTPLKEIKEVKIIAPEILETYVGKYELAPTFIITITTKNDHIYLQATGQPQFEIFASEEDEFYLRAVEAKVTFNKDDNGKVTSMILFQNGQSNPGKKIE